MRNTSREDCTYPMFWKLFNYISGQNERQEKIPMTAPVSVLVEPDGPSEADDLQNTFTMAFYIPAPFDENPPQPNDSSVSIEHRPEIRVLVRYLKPWFFLFLFNRFESILLVQNIWGFQQRPHRSRRALPPARLSHGRG